MSGERDLDTLRREMAPQLHPETFVYCSFPDFRIPPGLEPICTFREAEGVTAIVEKAQADDSAVPYVFESHLITRHYEGLTGPSGPRIRGRRG